MMRFLDLLGFLFGLSIYAAFLAFRVDVSGFDPALRSEAKVFVVKHGEEVSGVALRLQEEGLIPADRLFLWYLRWRGLDRSLRAGVYTLRGGSIEEVATALTSPGKGRLIAATILPDDREIDLLERLKAIGLVERLEDWERALTWEGRKFGLPRPDRSTVWGYLLPDTYHLPPGANVGLLADMALSNLERSLRGVDLERSLARLGMSLDEAMRLASIVEMETPVEEERRRVAGVFVNRLRRGMPLQSCATVAYALGVKYGRFSLEDVAVQSPFNTYLRPGLPPAPICNPSLRSILAVLDYEDHDFMFFVSRGDGTHRFSRTYEEHLRAKRLIDPPQKGGR